MEFINGKMDGFIKEILMMIIEMDMANYMMDTRLCTEDIGKMDSKMLNNNILIKEILIVLESQKVDKNMSCHSH